MTQKVVRWLSRFFIVVSLAGTTACSSSSSDAIDEAFGSNGNVPILTPIGNQVVSQTDLMRVDVNNIAKGTPGTDENMVYTCLFDSVVDGEVSDGAGACATLSSATVNFNSSTGVLEVTPQSGLLGNREFKIIGINKKRSGSIVFAMSTRLKFNGITSITSVTGTSVTLTWTPNTDAVAYQVFKLNSVTGVYELHQTISGGSNTGGVITGLAPNTSYSMRVQAVDTLGNLDGNVVTQTFTTTQLVQFSMSPATITSPAGTPIPITVQSYDVDGNPQTTGGLVLTPQMISGTSTGSFGPVTDNNDGTYSFTFTPAIKGTPVSIDVTTNVTLYMQNVTTVTVTPGAASSANSTLATSSGTVISSQSVNFTATVRDAYNNLVTGATVVFNATGGTSTGTMSAVTEISPGVYRTTFTGVTAGTAKTITVTVNGSNLSPSQTIQVLPGAPVSANSTLTISSSSVVSGNSVNVTATLRDVNNNPVPSGILVGFNKAGGSSTGTFGSVTNAGAGVYTTTYTGVASGTAQTITVSVDGVPLTPTVSISVVPGAPVLGNSTLTISSPTVLSGQFVTVTATLKDLNNNPVETGITVTYSATGGTSTGTFSSVTNHGAGVYSVKYTGVTAGTAQSIAVLVDGSNLGASVSITVQAGSPSNTTSTLALSAATVQSGNSVTLTATIKDSNNNPISSGYSVSFTATGGTSTGNISAVTNQGNGVYTATYTGVVAGTAQTIGISIDGSALGVTQNLTVLPGAPNSTLSTLTVTSNTVLAGQSVTLTFTLRDGNSNTISSGYTIGFAATGGTSTGSISAVTNQGNGVYTATYTGDVAGTAQTLQTLVNMAGFGPTQSITVQVGQPVAANSSITITTSPVASNTNATISATIRDVRNNPVTNEYAITFDAIGGTSTGTLTSASHTGSGVWQSTYGAQYAGSAQTIRVLADGAPIAGLTASIQVIPGAVHLGNSSFAISSATVQSGTNATLSVSLRDAFNNKITGSSVTFTKNSTVNADGTISPATATETAAGSGNYTSSYQAVQQGSAQTLQLVVNGTPVAGMTVSVAVSAGPPTQMTITRSANATNPMNTTECVGPVTVTLRDVNNNITSHATGVTINFSSDPWGSTNYHTGTIFADSSCATGATNLVFGPTVTNQTFYYRNYTPVNYTLTLVGASGIANQTLTLQTIPVLSWIGAIATPTVTNTTSQPVGTDLSSTVSTGFIDPLDILVDGTDLYVSDRGAFRILKFNLATTPYTFTGWVGVIGHKEGISAACAGQSIGNYTANWCTGGRAIDANNFGSLYGITSDATYLYAAVQHRILRIRKSNGQLEGWIGWASSSGASGFTCSGGTSSNNAMTPGWCPMSMPHTSTTATGGFNNPQDVNVMGTYLYVADSSNHRIQRFALDGTYAGWFGRINVSPTAGDLGCNGATGLTPGWCTDGTSQAIAKYSIGQLAAPLESEGFNNPLQIENDGTYLYISDYNNGRTIRFNPSTFAFDWFGRVGTSPNNPISPVQTNGAIPTSWATGGYTEGDTSQAHSAGRSYSVAVGGGKLYLSSPWHVVVQVDANTVQDLRYIGRVASNPTGGVSGCSSTPTMGVTPGWCFGSTWARVGSMNGAFNEPRGLAIYGSELFVVDRYNFRIQRFNISTGAFVGSIGAISTPTPKWTMTSPTGTQTFSRRGWNDNSFWGNWTLSSILPVGDYFILNDMSTSRLKRIVARTGETAGWAGYFDWGSSFIPTGPDSCLGIVNGSTPGFCTGGGRALANNTALGHMYNNPVGLATDGTWVYVSNYSIGRVDRFNATTQSYGGWTGRVSTTPTDGDPGCTSKVSGEHTGGWCVGGGASNTSDFGGFREGSGWVRGLFWDSDLNALLALDTGRLHRIGSNGIPTGAIGHTVAAGAVGCTVTGSVAESWCTDAVGSTGTNSYGGLNDPWGLWTNSTHIYVSDIHRIVRFVKSTGAADGWIGRFDAATGFNTTGTGGACNGISSFPRALPGWCFGTSIGVAMANNSAGSGNGELNTPRGIYGDSTYLYVADSNNNRIVRFQLSDGSFAGWKGVVGSTSGMTGDCAATAVVGEKTPGNYWCMGGTAQRSSLIGGFDFPSGVYVDSNYVYVMDSNNNRLVTLPK